MSHSNHNNKSNSNSSNNNNNGNHSSCTPLFTQPSDETNAHSTVMTFSPYVINNSNSNGNNNIDVQHQLHSSMITNQFIPSVELTPEEMQDFFGVAGGVASAATFHSNLSHEDLNSLHDDHTPSSSYHYPTATSFHPTMLPQQAPPQPQSVQQDRHATNTGVNVLGASYSTGSNNHNDDSTGGDGINVNDEGVLFRTERKRSREKQRRHDVNQQFAELNQTIRQIELETEEYRVPIYNSPNNRADMIARTVGLLKALHELNTKKHQEIQHLREELQRAQQAGEEAAAKLKESMLQPQNLGNNKVLMMVPMMMSAAAGGTEAGSHGGAAGPTNHAAPQNTMPPLAPSTGVVVDPATGFPNPNMMMPWMQQMMMQQMMPMMMMPSMPPATLAPETTASTTNMNFDPTSSSPPGDRPHHMVIPAPTTTLDQGEQKMSSNSSLNENSDNGNFVVGPNLAHCA